MSAKSRLALLICGACCTQTALADQAWLRWVNEYLVNRVDVSGFRRLGYHLTSVDGDSEAFRFQNYSGFGGDRFTDVGQIQLSGRRVLGAINFDATLVDDRFDDPQTQKFSIDVERAGWTLNLGDVLGSLPTNNRFVPFSRSLRGVQVGYKSGGFSARALRSEAKGSPRTVTLNGNNSPGPYYLQANQIIADSETVRVDGLELVRGTDYIISYEAGSLTFIDRNIPPTSTIAVTFEALGINSRRGDLEGVGISYNAGSAGRLGVSMMRQTAKTGNATGQRLEKFFGFGAPSVPYVLQFEPLAGSPVTIRVNGVIQVQGVDFRFDTLQPAVFYFLRFMPPTDEIDVIYTPRPTTTVDGDREVVGIDYRVGLGERGTLDLSHAIGRLKSPVNPTSGKASGIDLRYNFGDRPQTVLQEPSESAPRFAKRMEVGLQLRAIDPGFVSIDSRSFNRNERSGDLTLDMQLRPSERFGANSRNSLVTLRRVASNGDVSFDAARVTQSNFFGRWGEDTSQPLRLDYTRQRTRSQGNLSSVDTIALQQDRVFKQGSFRYGVQHQLGRAPIANTVNADVEGFRTSGLTASAGFVAFNREYGPMPEDADRPRESLRWDIRSQLNQTEYRGNEGTGYLVELTGNYQKERFSVNLLANQADSGSIISLGGFNDGTGLGLGNSGFNSGTGDPIGLGISSGRTIRVAANYQPSDSLNLSANWGTFRQSGGLSSNSLTDSYGLGASWEMGNHQLNARLDHSSTRFLESAISSKATTVSMSLEGILGARWSYGLRGNALLTSGGSTNQNGVTFEGGLGYRISPKEILTFDWSITSITGFRAQNDAAASITYGYRILDGISLNATYRLRDVRNQDGNSSGAYRFGGFDLVLGFDF